MTYFLIILFLYLTSFHGEVILKAEREDEMKDGNENKERGKGMEWTKEAAKARGLVNRAFARAEAIDDDPGQYFMTLAYAKKVLADWEEAYPEAAEELAAENKTWEAAEKARKEEEYRESYVARGLD